MKTLLLSLFVLAAIPGLAQPQTVADIPFDSSADFLKLPAGTNFGEVPGVAVNSKGHVFVFTRSNSAGGPAYAPTAAQLFEFGPKGEFIREIGRGLYAWSFAHSVRIDKDDNIWAIDKGSDMVIKFDQNGRVMMVFGRRKESADAETRPWEDVDPPLPAIAIDRNNNVYVGDRSNHRIQVFDTDGTFLRMFSIDVPPVPGTKAVNGNTPTGDRLKELIGAPNSLCIPPGSQVMFVGETTFPGRVFKVSLDGKVLGVIGRSGRQIKQFSGAHALACPSETEVYVAETSNWRVQKLTLRPVASTY